MNTIVTEGYGPKQQIATEGYGGIEAVVRVVVSNAILVFKRIIRKG
jgi:hypothetical protein